MDELFDMLQPATRDAARSVAGRVLRIAETAGDGGDAGHPCNNDWESARRMNRSTRLGCDSQTDPDDRNDGCHTNRRM